MAFIRTTLLLGLLTGILLAAGFLFAGVGGMTIALIFALLLNFFAYWYSDKIVLGLYKAKPSSDKKLNSIVEALAEKAELPNPKIYIVKSDIANAFATGRDPKHSAVAVTHGLLENLNKEEIEGVIAHELAHIKNRDTLVSTIAATIGGAISYLAQMAWWSLFMGDRNRGNAVLLPLIFLAPIAAMLVRMAISRGREFQADYRGALTTANPIGLASALEKISSIARMRPLRGNAASAHLWIVNPFKADSFSNLFSTHPPVEERIRRLKAMKI